VDVGRLAVARAFQDLAHKLGERGRLNLVLKVFADVAMMLGAVRREGSRRGGGDCDGSLRISVVGGERTESLERELVQQIGRNEIELEDCLAQISVVLVAVDLGGMRLVDGQEAARDQELDQDLVALREVWKRRGAGRGYPRLPHVRDRSGGNLRRGGRLIHGGDLLGVLPAPVTAGNHAMYPSCSASE
jgi:hypothetical protein